MTYHYSTKDFSKQSMARAVGIALPVSVKHSVEVCNYIRNRNIADAKRMLDKVITEKQAVPYRRFHQGLAHKTGIGPGRFPVNTSKEIKKLLESVEANAQFQGLSTANLIITSAVVQKAPVAWHYGRQRRRKMKRATIEIIAKESKAEPKKGKKGGKQKKAAPEAKGQKAAETVHQVHGHASPPEQGHAKGQDTEQKKEAQS